MNVHTCCISTRRVTYPSATQQTFVHFKIIIKNLLHGQLAWALAHGASEERKLLAREEIALVSDEQMGYPQAYHIVRSRFPCNIYNSPIAFSNSEIFALIMNAT